MIGNIELKYKDSEKAVFDVEGEEHTVSIPVFKVIEQTINDLLDNTLYAKYEPEDFSTIAERMLNDFIK